MPDSVDKVLHPVTDAVNQARQEDASAWLDLSDWKWKALVALLVLVLVVWIYRKLRRLVRKRRPPQLHPLLRKYGEGYGEPDEALTAKRRAEAAKIVVTSSLPTIVGYEIVEQVEAVFVDGFRRPEEALEGLKAVASMKGANAVTNVSHERGANGRCAARGDAVVIEKRARAATPHAAQGMDAQPPMHDTSDESAPDSTGT